MPRLSKFLLFVAAIMTLVTLMLVGFMVRARSSPEAAVKRFEERSLAGVPESEVADPLVLAGDAVLPVLVSRVADGKMPRRRYAIVYLGQAQHAPAMPLLKRIVLDETENIFCRGDALMAIRAINADEASVLSIRFVQRRDYLGRAAAVAWTVEPRRSYVAALLSSLRI